MKYKLLPCLFFSTLFSVSAHSQSISTIAGNGTAGFSGDSSLATLAELNNPFAVATDTFGNVFFTDRHNNRVRKILATGNIVTIAGNGTAGYNGDNIDGTVAQLNDPNGIAVDNSGNVYIADRLNNRIRKINATGLITTIAGTGIGGFAGDNAAATAAEVNTPRGVAVDLSGNIYIADQGNHRIRKVDAAGTITTIAGIGTGGFNGDGIAATAAELYNPYSIAADPSGNIYIADVDNERIRKVSPTGTISTVAGTGTSGFAGDGAAAGAAQLSEPIGVAADAGGNIYIADDYNARIRQVNAAGIINTIAGTGTAGYNGDGIPAITAELYSPTGVACSNNGTIYIADYNNNRVRSMLLATQVKNVPDPFSAAIFPNPNYGLFTLTTTSGIKERLQIMVSDATGKIVTQTTSTTNQSIRIEFNEQPGAYFITVLASDHTWRDKIILIKQ